MYGPRWYKLGPCFKPGCKKPVEVCIFDPYSWDDVTHETNKRYACIPHADEFFKKQGHVAEYLPSGPRSEG